MAKLSKNSSNTSLRKDLNEKKFLVIQQKMIGDVLTSSILCEAIKKEFPTAEVHYLVNQHTLPVLENNPFIDKKVVITNEIEKSVKRFYKFLLGIKNENYDVVIDVYGKIGSTLISYYSGAKIKIAYHKKHTSVFYSHTIERLSTPENQASLAIENRLSLLKPLGVNFQKLEPKIYLSTSEKENAKQFLEESGLNLSQPIVMISVLGSGPQKTYPPNYMAKLLDYLVNHWQEVQVLFNYIPKQREEALAIYSATTEKTQKHIYFEIFGKSLRQFLAITHFCKAVIGNEGGANNMAKALGIPTFSIFAPYLNKQNWFGKIEEGKHLAKHLSEFISFTEEDLSKSKKNPEAYYQAFKPEFLKKDLHRFIEKIKDEV